MLRHTSTREGPHVLPSEQPNPRRAACAFLIGATRGWGRRDLAQWLVCHYGGCVVVPLNEERREMPPSGTRSPFDSVGGLTPPKPPRGLRRSASLRVVDEALIERLV